MVNGMHAPVESQKRSSARNSTGQARKSRIDAPGSLQHVIGRAINRQEVFSDKAYKGIAMHFRSGDGETVQIGYINRNNQMCLGTRGRPGTDHLQLSYRMICLIEDCEFIYGANGTDVHERRCQRWQGGTSGISY